LPQRVRVNRPVKPHARSILDPSDSFDQAALSLAPDFKTVATLVESKFVAAAQAAKRCATSCLEFCPGVMPSLVLGGTELWTRLVRCGWRFGVHEV